MTFDKKEYHQKYYQNNKERIKATQIEWYHTHKEQRKEYKKENRLKINEYQREYQEKNRIKINKYQREWYKKQNESKRMKKVREMEKEAHNEQFKIVIEFCV